MNETADDSPAPVYQPRTSEPDSRPARDYARELVAALGDPAHCIKPRTAGSQGAAGSTVHIDLEAYVVGAGTVSRSYVRSSELDADESACVKRMLEAVRFAPPIDEPPRSVHADVTLTLRAPAAPAEGHPAEPSGGSPTTITAPPGEGAVEYVAPPPYENPAKEPAPE